MEQPFLDNQTMKIGNKILLAFLKVQLKIEHAAWDKIRFSKEEIPEYISGPQYAKVRSIETQIKEIESK